MNFFERQEKARQNTSYLVFLFSMAVFGIIAATCIVAVFIAQFVLVEDGVHLPLTFSNYSSVIGFTALTTVFIIVMGALYKWQMLGNSGMAVAEYMGGRLVDQHTKDPNERKLINVVEEMAIASGIPVPLIYIMTSEHAINAFAAGTSTHDAVVAVTTGTIENLTRDELQGVIAHEFSHIFNGDCKLNMRLIGYLAGIVTIGLIGRTLLEAIGRGGRHRSRKSSKDDGQAMAMMLIAGIALMVIGYVGVFAGRLIRAAISRQREYLADASAVQYTRFPAGIAGALAKIKDKSSYVMNGHAEEASHMFFDSPINPFTFFSTAMATHPPLDDRIAAIDRRFLDRSFLENTLKFPEETSQPKMHEKYTKGILDHIGSVEKQKIAQAGLLLAGLSPTIKEHHGDQQVAQAFVLSILMRNSSDRKAQLELIESLLETQVFATMGRALTEIDKSLPEQHMAIFELCAPAIRLLPQENKDKLLKAAEYIVRVDKHIDLVEASYLLLLRKLIHANDKKKNLSEKSLSESWDSIKILLASLAHHGHEDLKAAQEAYLKATDTVYKIDSHIPPRSFCDGKSLLSAVDNVSRCRPKLKKLVIEACYLSVEHDGEVTNNEMEMLRAITSCLDAPMPLTSAS